MAFPWDQWVPGVLNKPQMKELLDGGFLTYSGSEPKLDHSSIDLSLADEAYEMVEGSVKPFEPPYDWFITRKTKLAKKHEPLEDGSYELKRQKTYVFRLQEKLEARLRNAGVIYGQATAKSSVGRVDVLARLIVDGMKTYECFDPEGLKKGSGVMFLEITPITFNVRVKPDYSLSQLRFFYGKPDAVVIKAKELFNTIFRDHEHQDESLTVNLSDATIGDPTGTTCKGVAFRSKPPSDEREAVPLWKVADMPNPCNYWDVEVSDEYDRLYIRPDIFYILRSKEKLCVPKGVAIYCRASDETMGEMRIHYAGFVHPYFGLYREDKTQGTPLIFEVRGHQVPVSLADQEKMANLIFYRMSEDAPKLTSEQEEEEAKGYGSQDLKLSKFFADWPKHIKRSENGNVEAAQ
ncbi:MAG: 2'-deoxycytidine 5'-triphosphate deaminase [Candidatus Micrarchaeaceae archaeon]|jgi:dCTP deaminase